MTMKISKNSFIKSYFPNISKEKNNEITYKFNLDFLNLISDVFDKLKNKEKQIKTEIKHESNFDFRERKVTLLNSKIIPSKRLCDKINNSEKFTVKYEESTMPKVIYNNIKLSSTKPVSNLSCITSSTIMSELNSKSFKLINESNLPDNYTISILLNNEFPDSNKFTKIKKAKEILIKYSNKGSLLFLDYNDSDYLFKAIDSRTSVKIGKILKNIFPNESNTVISYLTEEIKNELSLRNKTKNNDLFKIVSGELIAYYYNENNYDKLASGTLGSSCMKQSYNVHRIRFYSENPDKIKLFIRINPKTGRLLGRAVLWKSDIDDKYYMDRIYSSDSSTSSEMISEATLRGFKNIYPGNDMPLNEKSCILTVNPTTRRHPYLDSMIKAGLVLENDEEKPKRLYMSPDRRENKTENDIKYIIDKISSYKKINLSSNAIGYEILRNDNFISIINDKNNSDLIEPEKSNRNARVFNRERRTSIVNRYGGGQLDIYLNNYNLNKTNIIHKDISNRSIENFADKNFYKRRLLNTNIFIASLDYDPYNNCNCIDNPNTNYKKVLFDMNKMYNSNNIKDIDKRLMINIDNLIKKNTLALSFSYKQYDKVRTIYKVLELRLPKEYIENNKNIIFSKKYNSFIYKLSFCRDKSDFISYIEKERDNDKFPHINNIKLIKKNNAKIRNSVDRYKLISDLSRNDNLMFKITKNNEIKINDRTLCYINTNLIKKCKVGDLVNPYDLFFSIGDIFYNDNIKFKEDIKFDKNNNMISLGSIDLKYLKLEVLTLPDNINEIIVTKNPYKKNENTKDNNNKKSKQDDSIICKDKTYSSNIFDYGMLINRIQSISQSPTTHQNPNIGTNGVYNILTNEPLDEAF